MINKQNFIDEIDWDLMLSLPRNPYGHSEVMNSLFEGAGSVISSWEEDGYQGDLAYAYKFADGSIAIVTDYFGSCSGCDSWDDCNDEDAIANIKQLIINARIFQSLNQAKEFCKTVYDDAVDYPMRAAYHLFSDMDCS